MQRTLLRALPRHRATLRTFTFTASSRAASDSLFNRGPAPPRLPKEEQELFEKLQRQSTGAFSTPRTTEDSPSLSPRIKVNQSPDSDSAVDNIAIPSGTREAEGGNTLIGGESEEQLVHPNLRRGAKPEFEGDVNPKTGEVGGPKNEPLRWGAEGDWSFNGRVTDF